MNRLKILLAAFVVAVVTLGIYSCAKDNDLTNATNVVDKRSNEGAFQKINFSTSSEISNYKKLAVGLSRMYNEDIIFKNYLNSKLINNDGREILVYDLFNCSETQSINELFNEKIQDSNINFDINQYINENPLVAILLQTEVLKSGGLELDELNLTFNYFDESTSENYAVLGDEILQVGEDAILGFIIKESEEFLIYDANIDEVEGNTNSFEENFLFHPSDCDIIQEYIQNQCEINNKKLINILDIQKLYFENCTHIGCCKPSIPPNINEVVTNLVNGNGGGNGSTMVDCDRGNIQEDIILPNLSTNSNHLLGFSLVSYTNFLAIDNQPCKLPKHRGVNPDANTTGQNLFSFIFTWVIGRDGGTFGTRELRRDVLRAVLVSEVYQIYVVAWKWNWICQCHRPVYGYRITGGTPNFVSLNVPVFSTTSTNNHWTPDNQGESFWINVKEFDATACSSTTSTVTTNATEVGGSLVFSKTQKNPTLNFKHIKTIQATKTVVVTGIQTQNLGNTFFEYCQPYPLLDSNSNPSFSSWLQSNTTGSMNIFLHSSWQ